MGEAMTPEQWEQARGIIQEFGRRIYEFLQGTFTRVRRFIRLFIETLQRVWAAGVLLYGDPADKVGAKIFLRTKNRRIKRKQWSAIRPRFE